MINKINQEIKEQFVVLNSSGVAVTGLVDGDFTKSLLESGSAASETFTITEKGLGYYYATFTPESTGYYEWVISHATYIPNGVFDYYTIITNDTDDVISDATTNTTSIEANSDANKDLVLADNATNTTTITTNTDNEIAAIDTKIDAQIVSLNRLLGLTQENQYIDNPVYDGNNALTSARLRTYSVAGSVGTTSDVLATYTVTSTYDGSGNLETYKVVKQ